MKLNKRWAILLILPAILLMADSCDGNTSSPPNEAQKVQENQNKLAIAVPLPNLNNSLERTNISKRLQMFDDPNKVSYIYLVSYGKVMSFYTIKGKVTSGSKRLTSPDAQLGSCNNYQGDNCTTTAAPELDGTYGSSASYIFFWTTDGVYVQWSGDYMEVDQPLKLSTQPELVQQLK